MILLKLQRTQSARSIYIYQLKICNKNNKGEDNHLDGLNYKTSDKKEDTFDETLTEKLSLK